MAREPRTGNGNVLLHLSESMMQLLDTAVKSEVAQYLQLRNNPLPLNTPEEMAKALEMAKQGQLKESNKYLRTQQAVHRKERATTGVYVVTPSRTSVALQLLYKALEGYAASAALPAPVAETFNQRARRQLRRVPVKLAAPDVEASNG